MPEANTPDVIEREIGATQGEFLRELHLAFPGGVSEDGGRIRAVFGPAAIEVVLTPLAPRVIALMTLPRLKVSLRGTAGSPEAQAALLARMDLAMQRGGG